MNIKKDNPREGKRAKIGRIKFNRFMVNCMNSRTEDILNDMAANNKAFKELTLKLIPILDNIKNALPSEYKKLLEELEDIRGLRERIVHKTLYRQGLKDGIRLYNVFRVLK